MRQSSGYQVSYGSFGYAFAALAVLASLALGMITLLVGTSAGNAAAHSSMSVQEMTTNKPEANPR